MTTGTEVTMVRCRNGEKSMILFKYTVTTPIGTRSSSDMFVVQDWMKVFKYTVTTPEAYVALQGIFYTDRLVVIIVLTNKL